MNKRALVIIAALAVLMASGIRHYAFTYDNAGSSSLELIRFHVLANSDSPEDQLLKLKVRDRIIEVMKEKLGASASLQETRRILADNLNFIEEAARTAIETSGGSYAVEAVLGDFNFPTRRYRDVVLAAGQYEALRVVIGEGKGQNWWCVMFPPLCFIDIKNGLIDEQTRRELKSVLSEAEYQAISAPDNNGELSLELRSKLWDFLKASKEELFRIASKF